jgi:hypothetical protein
VFSVIYAMVERRQLAGVIRIRRRVLTVLRVHLVKASGDKRLDEISTEDVQRLKAALTERAPKTVNNVLTVLSVVLRTAVEWGVILHHERFFSSRQRLRRRLVGLHTARL